ncbi:hypothetical protein N7468_004270 [Penicillium chermesinum]|uniref:Uncharacterized protein n=1 Tax=Penicillium chermesinum TaxID=63820 RepID=A0A9W9P8U7_9EURO|nr:uncharacterized protein N7468_004270 [Penicillium chermesinum]KAJ5239651.1 hypothetical protein N7468_004270 [Penicillium chermesinum]KAJ6166539.1 hypothetical protein N7470_001986 [Penicillium chermesinum]
MAEPSLEGLPIELKIQVLWQVSTVHDLKSLVLASPGFHRSYLLERRELLEFHVQQQYSKDLDLAEALTAVRSRGNRFYDRQESAIALLDLWRRRDEFRELGLSSSRRMDKAESLEEVIELLHLHKKLSFFVNDYAINTPKPPKVSPAEWKNEYLPLKLSSTERGRILRALCRLQILKNIFGKSVLCEDWLHCSCGKFDQINWTFGQTTESKTSLPYPESKELERFAFRLFYGAMPPWESEEMCCVNNYLMKKVKVVAEEVVHDIRQLLKNTPTKYFWEILPIEERPPFNGSFEYETNLNHVFNHFEGIAGLGPEFLYRLLKMDRRSRRNVFVLQVRPFYGNSPFLGLNTRDMVWDDTFPLVQPATRHDYPGFEQLWPTLPPIEQPSAGWRKAWVLPSYDEEGYLEDALNYEYASKASKGGIGVTLFGMKSA